MTPAGANMVESRRKERIGRLAALADQLDPHHRQALAASLLDGATLAHGLSNSPAGLLAWLLER